MLFRQFFDHDSYTYTYLIATREGGDALLIDPVLSKVKFYLKFINELNLNLRFVIDTHVHADHITGAGELKRATGCKIAMSHMTKAQGVDIYLNEYDRITIGPIALKTLLTPGHTDDSLCMLADDRLFTGDTLFIRGTGRTDFQHGCAETQYHCLFDKLLSLDDATLIYPGHDYNGATVSTIGEEKRYNPRLQVNSSQEYVALMASLNLPNPKLIDIAVPANLNCGLIPEREPSLA